MDYPEDVKEDGIRVRTGQQEFVDLVGFEGLYKINRDGQIMSVGRFAKMPRNGKNAVKYLKPMLLKIHNGVYPQITLRKNGKQTCKHIHRLLANNFIDNPDNKQQVNHKDGNKFNYKLSNLEWATPSENSIHAYRVLKVRPSALGKLGKDNHKSIKILQIDLYGKVVKMWNGMREAERGGFSSSAICRCCKDINKTHLGFKWKYE
jgi:hypothetical protein